MERKSREEIYGVVEVLSQRNSEGYEGITILPTESQGEGYLF